MTLTVITGPPCSGKTTYAEKHKKTNDIVIDLDKIAMSIGGQTHEHSEAIYKTALDMRRAAIESLKKVNCDAWIIDTHGRVANMLDAEVVELNPGIDVCLERAKERPEWTSDVIREWYKTHKEEKKMDTVKQEATTQEAEKTYTQADIDRIIGDRLAREKAKYADYEEIKAKAEKYDAAEEAQKSELQKATERADALQAKIDELEAAEKIAKIKAEVSEKTGIPVSLLTGTTEEACSEQAAAIAAYTKQHTYPEVKDSGEVSHGGGSNKDLFAQWINKY